MGGGKDSFIVAISSPRDMLADRPSMHWNASEPPTLGQHSFIDCSSRYILSLAFSPSRDSPAGAELFYMLSSWCPQMLINENSHMITVPCSRKLPNERWMRGFDLSNATHKYSLVKHLII